jgi:hypothetical protein
MSQTGCHAPRRPSRASRAGYRRRAGTPGGAPRHNVAGEPRKQAAEPGGATHHAEATTGPWPRASSQGGPAQDTGGPRRAPRPSSGRHGRAAPSGRTVPGPTAGGRAETAPRRARRAGRGRWTEPSAGEPCRRAMAERWPSRAAHAGQAEVARPRRAVHARRPRHGMGHAARAGGGRGHAGVGARRAQRRRREGKRGREGGRWGRAHLGESRTAGGTSGARQSSTIGATAILRGREARTGELREVREKRASWGWRRCPGGGLGTYMWAPPVATGAGQLPSAHARDGSGASCWGGWAASQPACETRAGEKGARLGRARYRVEPRAGQPAQERGRR